MTQLGNLAELVKATFKTHVTLIVENDRTIHMDSGMAITGKEKSLIFASIKLIQAPKSPNLKPKFRLIEQSEFPA